MDRALREFRIRGVATNLAFLENVIAHPRFRDASYTTRFIDETPELTVAVRRRDRATKLLNYIADVTVNGHPETRGRAEARSACAEAGRAGLRGPPGRRHEAAPRPRRAAKAFADWMRDEKRVLVTDTTMRDAHQSLLATRMRTHDIVAVAPAYATALPELLSLECWGGATFDVAMRFLTEDPWERLAGDPRARAEHPAADAAPRRERRRLHQLSRQRRALLRRARRRRPASTFSASSTA